MTKPHAILFTSKELKYLKDLMQGVLMSTPKGNHFYSLMDRVYEKLK